MIILPLVCEKLANLFLCDRMLVRFFVHFIVFDSRFTIGRRIKRPIGEWEMWKVKLNFTDYFTNTVQREYSLDPGGLSANDGATYTSALAAAAAMATEVQLLSEAVVTVHSVYWDGDAVLLPSNLDCKVKNVLSMSFDLAGKAQKGRVTIPCPLNSAILDSNRQIDLVAIRNSDFVQRFLDGSLVISDGDTASWLRDANLISLKGNIETE